MWGARWVARLKRYKDSRQWLLCIKSGRGGPFPEVGKPISCQEPHGGGTRMSTRVDTGRGAHASWRTACMC
eukprot:360772-Chlamydomonas_euryale.AAC.6